MEIEYEDVPQKKKTRYASVIAKVFLDRYTHGAETVQFTRDELTSCATELGIKPPKNWGDPIYSARYRAGLPPPVKKTERDGKSWIIVGAGIGKYKFRLVEIIPIVPNEALITIKIPDATPEIVAVNKQNDEQALLARVRYNRLIDIFLGVTTYSLQNHFRTTVEDIGQVELDEVYVGVDKSGRQFVIPVQAKGGKDRHSPVQTLQDIACCKAKFPNLACRPISAQFMKHDIIALFLLMEDNDTIRIVEEKHYKLVPSSDITQADLETYNQVTVPS